ncbi:hypothetical protein COEREDRAFT_12855 [Coemansia reversa NRRL 1564]|uniref:DH domain-containing protein n=1 Tax=Coemansia reversa (strain ATCC 12441 / NRRL 1564) TaxID=763665 RepID=A0A2G5BKC3_COERN|nr:hypothetical protein COEREDRAFT_12855 [Coemansia reversa NRRL 1564]|eukprot:PIA19484.1 hypothetical protein COEREDRAFT_12855 [Coemansia reversa NRRL 1564]
MLARSQEPKNNNSNCISDYAMGSLESVTMDSAATRTTLAIGSSQQQRRRRAGQHVSSALSLQEPSTHHRSSSAQMNARAPQLSGPVSVDTTDSSISTAFQENVDTSDEELYLRRVSVLYHELWTRDWAENQMASIEYSASDNFKHQAIQSINSRVSADICDSPTESELPSTAASAQADVNTKTTAAITAAITDADSEADTIPPSISGDATESGTADTSNDDAQQELRSSWGSLVDAYADTVSTPHTTAPQSAVQMAEFSSTHLADALVGTVRRLEDDHTLLQHKRWSVVKELTVTEAQYLQDLLLLRAVFLEPLADVHMRAEDVQVIFGNLDQVIGCARSLVEYLTVAVVYEASRCVAPGGENSESRACSYPDAGSGDTAAGHRYSTGAQRQCNSRPASQPEAALACAGDVVLRSSAWADISIAQAFLQTSQRMERVYAEYCQNFEAATRRIVELKRLAAVISTPASLAAAPTTPGSPFADPLRGWRQTAVSPAPGHVAAFVSSIEMQSDRSSTETMYAAAVYQQMTEQAQLLAGKTTSWDLPSLLIKPVQRILKYPLLLHNLLNLTHAHSLDRNQLEEATQSSERIAEAINAVNSTSGLHISATLPITGDEGQGRVARELRRVLRRRPGTTAQARDKPHTEGSVKDKLRLSARSKFRVRGLPERSWPSSVGTPRTNGTEALIEQHENRIAELTRSLRRWENDLGAVLRQQVALAARWRDLYATARTALDPVATSDTSAYTRSMISDVRLSNDGLSQSSSKNDDFGACLWQWQVESPSAIAFSLSSEKTDGLEDTGDSLRGADAQCSRYPQSDCSVQETQEFWVSRRWERALQYHAALDDIYKVLYPDTVCHLLHSKIYPVLNSLIQIYSDGPRYILGELSRVSNSSIPSMLSSANSDDSRLSSLQNSLTYDLPKLFDYERTVVHLLLEQIVRIQRNFYSRVTDILSPITAIDSLAPQLFGAGLVALRNAAEEPIHPCIEEARSQYEKRPVNRNMDFSQNPSHKPVACSESGGYIKTSFDKRANEPISPSPRMPVPSAADCINQIRSGIWQLTQEPKRHTPAHYVVKARHRRGTAATGAMSDSISDRSIIFDGCTSVSVFELSSSDVDNTEPTADASDKPWPTSAHGQSDDATVFSDATGWQFLRSSAAAPSLATRPVSSKHAHKKSAGFIERIAQFKPRKIIRGYQSTHFVLDRTSDCGNLDSVKPRSQFGLGIDVSDESAAALPGHAMPSRAKCASRAKSDADIHRRVAGWSGDAARFEPLPLVDPTRFSKGFIDAAFHILDNTDKAADT